MTKIRYVKGKEGFKNSILNFGRYGMLFLFIIMIIYVRQSHKV